ncbi:protoglobin domain-containing protein [Thermodesulfobium sp. 4217-1]|uniref:protoglobin domain-containing protein n=1 Tax=Thermodesulfobium sp. 4217-1 TaxID=3120013 RepID=UPI0032220E00
MESSESIKKIYNFKEIDKDNLESLCPAARQNADNFLDALYSFLSTFPDYNKFLGNTEVRKRHRERFKAWFLELFCGKYDESYIIRTQKIGHVHADMGLPTHYVSATMSFVRYFIHQTILLSCPNEEERINCRESVDKILDINLDILTSSYVDENKIYIARTNIESKIVRISSKISYYFDIALILALVFTSFMIFVLFLSDIYNFIRSTSSFESSVINILGAMLIIWTIRELLEEELKRLKGKKFALNIFISLAMAAMLRKILIFSLEPHNSTEVIVLGFLVLILGIVYWLMNQSSD